MLPRRNFLPSGFEYKSDFLEKPALKKKSGSHASLREIQTYPREMRLRRTSGLGLDLSEIKYAINISRIG